MLVHYQECWFLICKRKLQFEFSNTIKYSYVQYRLRDSYHFPIASGRTDSGSGRDNNGVPMCDQHLYRVVPELVSGFMQKKSELYIQ